jgi:hypothetical protein
MDYHKNLKTLLDEALELKNVNLEKLSQTTGIPERYIWAIQNVEIDRLPPSPYVRGYIKKISEVLNLNHDELWDLYEKELTHKTSGAYDKLPTNRFAIKHISKKTVYLGLLGILFTIYVIFSLDRLTGEPKLEIINPREPITATTSELIILAGTLEKQKDKLTINGKEIFVNANGTFSQEYSLQPGLNTIEFKAERLLGREKIIIKQVLYQPEAAQQPDRNQTQ